MLFPIHEIPNAPARVQLGFIALILGAAWLLSGMAIRAWARRTGGESKLRAFSANRDWRWVGAILVIGGLCVARPWGMDAGPFIWLRHTALLVLVLLIAECFAIRQRRDLWLSGSLLVGLIIYTVISLRLLVRYTDPLMGGPDFLSSPWLETPLFFSLVGAGSLALLAGLWRMVRHFRDVAPLQSLATLLMIPLFAEGTMLAGAIDSHSRHASHAQSIDGIFTRQSSPAGVFVVTPPCESGVESGEMGLFAPKEAEEAHPADDSGCHSCPGD